MLWRTNTSSSNSGIPIVIFFFIWLSGLAVAMSSCAYKRGEVRELLSRTPVYRCLKLASGARDPYVSWSEIRYLRPNYSGTSTAGGAIIATISERRGTDCILGGNAITFVHLPITTNSKRILIPFPGKKVETEFRGEDNWIDFLSEDGLVHYRNDGSGYYVVP